MLKEELEFLSDFYRQIEPVIEIDGRKYSNNRNGLVPILEILPSIMEFSTLTGLVEWAKEHGTEKADGSYFVVNSYDRVLMHSKVFGAFNQRALIAVARNFFKCFPEIESSVGDKDLCEDKDLWEKEAMQAMVAWIKANSDLDVYC